MIALHDFHPGCKVRQHKLCLCSIYSIQAQLHSGCSRSVTDLVPACSNEAHINWRQSQRCQRCFAFSRKCHLGIHSCTSWAREISTCMQESTGSQWRNWSMQPQLAFSCAHGKIIRWRWKTHLQSSVAFIEILPASNRHCSSTQMSDCILVASTPLSLVWALLSSSCIRRTCQPCSAQEHVVPHATHHYRYLL